MLFKNITYKRTYLQYTYLSLFSPNLNPERGHIPSPKIVLQQLFHTILNRMASTTADNTVPLAWQLLSKINLSYLVTQSSYSPIMKAFLTEHSINS